MLVLRNFLKVGPYDKRCKSYLQIAESKNLCDSKMLEIILLLHNNVIIEIEGGVFNENNYRKTIRAD